MFLVVMKAGLENLADKGVLMRYTVLFCYVTGFALVGHVWFSSLPLKYKLIFTSVGILFVVIALLLQWFKMEKR